MMKKVLALIAALAISCFGSMVFAGHEIVDVDKPATSGSIEVYGAAKLSVDVIDTGAKATGADKSLTKVSSNSSRVGFKGSEALSEDLSTVFQLELGVNMDGTTTTVSNATTTTAASTTSVNSIGLRNTFVGLKSKGLGMVILGTHDTPYKSATGQFDPFGDSMADYNAIIGNVNGTANFELRPKDVIAYVSPSLGGAVISVAKVQTGTESASSSTSRTVDAYSTSATYNAGALALALAYEVHQNGVSTWESAPDKKNTGIRLGAGYTFGGTKVGFVFESLNDDTEKTAYSRDAMYLSVSHKLGNETIKFAYGNAADGDSTADTAATMMALGADHAFSKRTSAYVLYAAMANDKGAKYGLGAGGAGGAYTPAADDDPSVISFGMNHSF